MVKFFRSSVNFQMQFSPIMGGTITGEYDGFAYEHESPDNYEYVNVVDDDEEGFPSFRLLQDEDEDELGEEDEEEKVFPSTSENKPKQLKQGNLLDMWGIKRPQHSSPSLPPPRKKTRTGKNSEQEIVKSKPPKSCPFYKKIPGTPFSVDAFRYGSIQGCSAYFLTHFHSDHYGGLTKGWSHGRIYCSPLTARLLTLCLSVDPRFISPLEFNVEYVIHGVCVTFLDANHCPGAVLIHFRLIDGQTHLHTGDFRACKAMQTHPLLANQRVHILYLDTTYCNPKYRFPSKEDVLSYVVRITESYLKKHPNTLVVVGAYSIGKECVYLAISEALGVKIYANTRRRRILHSFGWPELSGCLCAHGSDTFLHVLPMSCLRFESLKDYLKGYANQYKAVLAFRPTGWTYSEQLGNQLDLIRPSSKGNITIYGVPYSEHSSFTELQEFVQFLKPDKIIPTVNAGKPANRDRMQSYFREMRNS